MALVPMEGAPEDDSELATHAQGQAEPRLLLSPIFAGAAMAMSSVSVVSNALRLRRVRL